MNWKKFLLIGLAICAFGFAPAPQAEARVSVSIGFGVPFGYYPYGYPGYYPYGYPYYEYYGYRPRYRARRVVYVAPRYYRHRVHHPRRYHRWR